MPYSQIERLKNDKRELDNYIYRMKKKGKDNLVKKLSEKQAFLSASIEQYDEIIQQSA